MSNIRKPDVNLDDEDFRKSVELLAKHWGVSPKEAVRRAVFGKGKDENRHSKKIA